VSTTANQHLVDTRWRINDSGREFTVLSVDTEHAHVANVTAPQRPRRIRIAALTTSTKRTGYTQVAPVAGEPR
jgi:hypothetical protein